MTFSAPSWRMGRVPTTLYSLLERTMFGLYVSIDGLRRYMRYIYSSTILHYDAKAIVLYRAMQFSVSWISPPFGKGEEASY